MVDFLASARGNFALGQVVERPITNPKAPVRARPVVGIYLLRSHYCIHKVWDRILVYSGKNRTGVLVQIFSCFQVSDSVCSIGFSHLFTCTIVLVVCGTCCKNILLSLLMFSAKFCSYLYSDDLLVLR